jgi:hypothetical protein
MSNAYTLNAIAGAKAFAASAGGAAARLCDAVGMEVYNFNQESIERACRAARIARNASNQAAVHSDLGVLWYCLRILLYVWVHCFVPVDPSFFG